MTNRSLTDHRITHRSARDTRGHILAVALELFGKHGFEATSLQQIADRLGVTKAALYYHFKSKDDLLLAVLEPYFTDIAILRQQRDKDVASPAAEPSKRIEDYLDLLLEHREILSFLSRDAAALARPGVAVPAQTIQDLTTETLAGSGLTIADQVKVNFALGGMRNAITAHASTSAEALRGPILESVQTIFGTIEHRDKE